MAKKEESATLAVSPPRSATATKTTAPPKKREPAPRPQNSEELARVREIILGPDTVQQRLHKPEADRLRQIIFGAHMEEYSRRFSDLEREMERVSGELRQMQDQLAEFQKAWTQRIEAMERDMNRTDGELWRELERVRAQEPLLQRLLTQVRQQEMLGQRLAGNTDALRESSAQQERDHRALRALVNEHRDQRVRKIDDLRREIRQVQDNLRVELHRVADRLNDQKTDRRALAAMLIEIATRLETGANVTVLLEELTNASEG